ncbi:uncharacterized protein LOC126829808 [Patella vulgata]|uniref:uncharacterized protein LOC126829808 n=1 Tax=Patella vulgata TaxID=6465 RepID=UPI00217F280E|nr:uncharacterized protein LOC126829808 [Patella vulgata]
MFVFLLIITGSIFGCFSGKISEDGIPEFKLNQSLNSFSTLNISNDKSIQVLDFNKSTSRCELDQLQFSTPDFLCNASTDTITLRIGNVIVSNEDVANYTCTNYTHEIDGCWQYLVVLQKAKILGMKPDFNPLEVFEGSDVSLLCEADESVYPIITNFIWKKDGQEIPSEVNETYKLTNISTDSSGTYECTTRNSIGSSFPVQKKLSVLVWPTMVPQFYEINSTGNTNLVCNVTGTVYWRKMGSKENVCYGSPTCPVSIQESTYYECFSTTTHISSFGCRVSKTTSATFHVIYQYKPELQNIHENPIQLTSRLGHPFETKLAFKAYPNAKLSILSTSVTLNVSEVQPNVFKISSDKLTTADFANYTIQATNTEGNTTFSLWLKGHPEPPVNLTYQIIEPHLVALSWEPGFSGGTSQTFQVHISTDGSDWQKYNCSGANIKALYCNVTDLEVDVVHLFVVTSLNGYGLVSQKSNTLIVLIKSKEKGTSVGIIVGSVCSCTLLIIVITLCVIYRPCRNICNSKPDNNEPDGNTYEQPESKRSYGSMVILILENIRNTCRKDGSSSDNEAYDTAKGCTEQEHYDTLDVRNENPYINRQTKTSDNVKRSDDDPIYENMNKSSPKKKTRQRTPSKTTELSVTESQDIYENMNKSSPKRKTKQRTPSKTKEVELSVTENKDIYENMNK